MIATCALSARAISSRTPASSDSSARALCVFALGLRLDALEFALLLARPHRSRAQLGNGRTRRLEIGARALDLRTQRALFRAYADALRLRARLSLARGIARADRGFGPHVRRVQYALGFRELLAQPTSASRRRRRLEPAGQNRALALEASAGDRASAGDLFAPQRDDRVAQAAPAHQLDAGFERRHDQHVAHEEVDDPLDSAARCRTSVWA